MSIDWKKCRETKGGNIATPRCRMAYPALLEPKNMKGESDPAKRKYQISLLVPKGANLDLLKKAAQAVLNENMTPEMQKKTKWRSPFLKTADQLPLAEYADEYPVLLRANAQLDYPPQIVNPDMSLAKEPSAIYAGRWCSAAFQPFFYDHPQGGKGVSFGLQNVQLLDHDEPITGGSTPVSSDFENVSDEFSADDGWDETDEDKTEETASEGEASGSMFD